MQKRESYERKHVHRWELIKKTPAKTAGWFYKDFGFQQEYQGAEPMRLIRECADCGLVQCCDVDDESKLVTGYEAVCDFDWKETV